MMLLARVATAAAGLVAAAEAVPQQQKLTVYRITPIQDEGVMNMDTADAAGDVYFGLSQLLLPYLCANGDNMLWCANRKWLSAGTAWMVYRKFVGLVLMAFIPTLFSQKSNFHMWVLA